MKKKSTEEFIQDAYCKHGDRYNYKLVDYKNARTKVKIICDIHGVFEQMPSNHLRGNGCPVCAGNIKKTTEQFIIDAKKVHGDKYDYSLVCYDGHFNKIKIVCKIHGIFEQTSGDHLKGRGCPECGKKITTKEFIEKAKKVHGDKYDYSLVRYIGCFDKVKIICHKHGIFEQISNIHIRGGGCPKCVGQSENKYDLYADRLLGVECRRNKEDKNILEVKCMYCGKWYIPTLKSVKSKIQAINGKGNGECNLYCSDECKKACPTYNQKKYPKDFKLNTSREVQPALRKLVLKRDNYTCQKCNAKDKELHCHHYEGIEVNPIESADIDNCITLCIDCHHETHSKDKCGMKDYRKKGC